MQKTKEFNPYIGAALIIFVTTLIRFWFVYSGQTNLYTDEAQYWDWSRTLQLSYYSKGPLIAYVIRFWTQIFGPTELGVRFGAVFNTFLMQIIIFWSLTKIWSRPKLAFYCLIVANTMPLFITAGVLMPTDNLLILFWLIAFFILYTIFTSNTGPWAYFVLALALGLGILAKYTMLLFVPLSLACAWLKGRKDELPAKFWPRFIQSLVCGTCIGLLPILIWNITHDFAGIKHVLYRGSLAGEKARTLLRPKYFPEYLGSQLGVLTPWWFVFCLIGAVKVTRGLWSQKLPFALNRTQGIILTVFFWPIWLFFLLFSLHGKVEANWSATSYCAGIVLTTLAFVQTKGAKKWLWPALGGLLFILIYGNNYLPLPEKLDLTRRMKGWAELGLTVNELKKAKFNFPEKVFVFSDTYGVTAELSFYVPGQKRAYCVNAGRKYNQYDFWPGPLDKKGWDAIFVQKGIEHKVPPEVKKMFAKIDPGLVLHSRHKGRPGRTFTIFCCYNYNGYWPESKRESY
jgi:4-amino-4-deoxy-L-arabinose transferase-like glycosyltransferase